jgi:hypothetical protein
MMVRHAAILSVLALGLVLGSVRVGDSVPQPGKGADKLARAKLEAARKSRSPTRGPCRWLEGKK